MSDNWYDSRGVLTDLLVVLFHTGVIDGDIESIAYFLRKPWKYDREFAVWDAAGQPDVDDLAGHAYDVFAETLLEAAT